jgi:RNA polymerase sigma-70 factor (ECF subfamily)
MGIQYLQYAHDSNATSRFIYEAAIASLHSVADGSDQTNWPVVVALYDKLALVHVNPVDDIRRATAILYDKGATDALQALQESKHIFWLKRHYLYYALLGKINSVRGIGIESIRHYEKALKMCRTESERQYLEKRVQALKTIMN